MAEIYPLGQNRIFYRAAGLGTPERVTASLLDPDLNNNLGIELIEVEVISGLFYFEAIFSKEGTYIAIFYEDGVEKTTQAFSTRKIPAVSSSDRPRSFLGDNVINT